MAKKAKTEIVKSDKVKQDVPSGVVNVHAYNQMLKLEESKVFSEDVRIIQTSDEDLDIDLFMNEKVIDQKITHLPEDEQAMIIRRAKGTRIMKGRVEALRDKAYGMTRPRGRSAIAEIVLKERSAELIEYFGKFYSPKEVHKIVIGQWGMTVSLPAIQRFERKNFTEIKKAQEAYVRDHKDVRLSHKKARLEELTSMYHVLKERHNESSSREDYKLMLQTLKLISDMVEGHQVHVAGEINHKIETTINYHVQQEVMKNLTINDIIIARVAARNRINPRFLSARLHQSIYAQHSGFAANTGDLGEQEIVYPSSMVYNWAEVKKLHEKKDAQDAIDVQYEEITPEDEAKAMDVKDKLLERIKARKEQASESRKRIEDNSKDKTD
jgi:hypothetical protein